MLSLLAAARRPNAPMVRTPFSAAASGRPRSTRATTAAGPLPPPSSPALLQAGRLHPSLRRAPVPALQGAQLVGALEMRVGAPASSRSGASSSSAARERRMRRAGVLVEYVADGGRSFIGLVQSVGDVCSVEAVGLAPRCGAAPPTLLAPGTVHRVPAHALVLAVDGAGFSHDTAQSFVQHVASLLPNTRADPARLRALWRAMLPDATSSSSSSSSLPPSPSPSPPGRFDLDHFAGVLFNDGQSPAHCATSAATSSVDDSDATAEWHSAARRYAAHRVLTEHRTLFVPSGGAGVYRCRQPSVVQHVVAQARQRSDEAALEQRRRRALARLVARHAPDASPAAVAVVAAEPESAPASEGEEWTQFVRRLKAYALQTQPADAELDHVARTYLAPLGLSRDARSLMALLRRCGLWDDQAENPVELLFPERMAPFDASMASLAAAIASSPPPDSVAALREPWDQPVWTIDEPTAFERDDAVSVWRHPTTDAPWMCVHIADPTRWFDAHSPLDVAARARAASIYLPDRCVSMFPGELLALASLRPDRENNALTIGARLDADGAVVDSFVRFTRLSRVRQRTYTQVDGLLDGSVPEAVDGEREQLRALAAMAERRRAYRFGRGAEDLEMPGVATRLSVDASQPSGVQLVHTNGDTGAWRLVKECMVTANEVVARHAHRFGFVVPFRGHVIRSDTTGDDASVTMEGSPVALAGLPALERADRFLPALMTATMSEHRALGVAGYTHSTSPLRRYTDIITHHQLKAHALGGRSFPWSQWQLSEALVELQHILMQNQYIEARSEEFWALRLLRRRLDDGHHTHAVLVVGTPRIDAAQQETVTLLFLELGFKLRVTVRRAVGRAPVATLARGTQTTVRLLTVDIPFARVECVVE